MSNQKEEEFKLTLELLKQSFTIKDSEKQKEILVKLKELFNKDPMNHFQLLIKGLTLDNNQVPLDVKKSIGIYINTLLNAHREALGDKSLLELLKFVIQAIIFSEYIGTTPFFFKSITLIISSRCLMKDFSYLKEVFDFLLSTISQCQNDLLFKQGKGVIGIIQIFIKSPVIDGNGIAMISQQIFNIIDSFFSLVPMYVSISSGVNVLFVDLLRLIYEFFIDLLKKMKAIKMESSHIVFLFEKYGLYTWELINLNMFNEGGNSIIYFASKDIQLDNQVNLMKGKAIQFIASLLSGSGMNLKNNDFVVYTSKIINAIIASIDNLIRTNFKVIPSLRDKDLSDGVNLVVYSMSIFLSRALIRNPIKEEFSPLINNFILNIIFPLLLSSPNDVNEIKDDGEKYFAFISDLTQDHEIKTCRTAVASLLQKVCDHYAFVSSLIINFILRYLDALLSDDNTTDLSFNQFSMLLDANSPIITKEYEYRVDFCLLILILLENFVENNNSFKQTLKAILLKHNEKIHGLNSILVSDKLCLFYGTYLPLLFGEENNSDAYKFNTSVFNYLMNILLNNNQYEGLGYQSANTIYNLLYESDIGKDIIFSDIINQNIAKINILIEESDVHLFHSILIYISEKIDFNSEDNQLEFLAKITKRMHKEILESKSQREMSSFIESGFAILNKFLERKQLTNNKALKVTIESFESMVTPIVLYIKNPLKICFEDSIIDLMKNEIISTRMIPPLPLSILPTLQLTCKKNKMLSETEYNYFCAFIKNDSNGECTARFLNEITFLIYLGYQLEPNEVPKLPLLLTLALLTGNSALSNDKPALVSLLSKTYENITNWEKSLQNAKSFFNDFELILLASFSVICTAMISKPVDTLDFLIEANALTDFIKNFINVLKLSFKSTKLMKQIILGLCSLVHTPETQKKLIQFQILNRILQCVMHFTQKQKKDDTAFIKKIMNKEIRCNFIHNEDNINEFDSNEMDFDEDDEEKKKYYSKLLGQDNENGNQLDSGLLIKEINFPHENIDEYLTFTQCVKGLNEKLLISFVQELNDNEKQLLNDLSLIKKVDVMYHEKKISVPRKTVKIKRQNQDSGNANNSNNNNNNDDNMTEGVDGHE